MSSSVRRASQLSRMPVLALAAALTLGACSGDASGEGDASPTTQAAAETADNGGDADGPDADGTGADGADADAERDEEEAASAAEAGVEPRELGDPVATVETAGNMSDDADATLTYDVYPLQRDGDILTFAARVTLNSTSTQSANLASIMGVGSNFSIGVSLIDTENLRRHAVVRAGSDTLSSTPLTIRMSAGQSRYISGVFAAPPDDVTTMTVVLDGIPAIANVPIR